MYYLYQSHLGGCYIETEDHSYDDLYCETCGDSDSLMDTFSTARELRILLKCEGYDDESIGEYIMIWEDIK